MTKEFLMPVHRFLAGLLSSPFLRVRLMLVALLLQPLLPLLLPAPMQRRRRLVMQPSASLPLVPHPPTIPS